MVAATQLQVMVVDDTSVSRALVVDALDQAGIRNVAVAKDGQQALSALMLKPVHLVLSDMNMPGMDGLEFLKALREYKPTANIGFILITGSADRSLIERGQKLRMNNFVPKPFTPASLKAAVEKVVGRLT